jgi:hypothetical protein
MRSGEETERQRDNQLLTHHATLEAESFRQARRLRLPLLRPLPVPLDATAHGVAAKHFLFPMIWAVAPAFIVLERRRASRLPFGAPRP